MSSPCYEQSSDKHHWETISVEEVRSTAVMYYENPDDIQALLDRGTTISFGATSIRAARTGGRLAAA